MLSMADQRDSYTSKGSNRKQIAAMLSNLPTMQSNIIIITVNSKFLKRQLRPLTLGVDVNILE